VAVEGGKCRAAADRLSITLLVAPDHGLTPAQFNLSGKSNFEWHLGQGEAGTERTF